jgi:hypothetical protein
MLRPVRAGQKVVSVFYGHPGVFVAPSHRTIDPSNPGTQTVEATEMLVKERPLLTSSHVIIYQVGGLANLGFDFSGMNVGVHLHQSISLHS